jgi:hypothetical protein
MRSASLIVIGLSASLIASMQPNLNAATGETAKFDGNWSVTVDIKAYKNGNGSIAEPLTRHLSVTVKDGVLRGERGIRTKPGWYELSGKSRQMGQLLFAPMRSQELRGITLRSRQSSLLVQGNPTPIRSSSTSKVGAEQVKQPTAGPVYLRS